MSDGLEKALERNADQKQISAGIASNLSSFGIPDSLAKLGGDLMAKKLMEIFKTGDDVGTVMEEYAKLTQKVGETCAPDKAEKALTNIVKSTELSPEPVEAFASAIRDIESVDAHVTTLRDKCVTNWGGTDLGDEYLPKNKLTGAIVEHFFHPEHQNSKHGEPDIRATIKATERALSALHGDSDAESNQHTWELASELDLAVPSALAKDPQFKQAVDRMSEAVTDQVSQGQTPQVPSLEAVLSGAEKLVVKQVVAEHLVVDTAAPHRGGEEHGSEKVGGV